MGIPPNALAGLDGSPDTSTSSPGGSNSSVQPAIAPTVASPAAGPHAGLVNFIQSSLVGLGAFAKSAATQGREGGPADVQAYQANQQAMALRAQQAKREADAAQQQKEDHALRMKMGTADLNMKTAQLAQLIADAPLHRQLLFNQVQNAMLENLEKKGILPSKQVEMVEGASTGDHVNAVSTAADGNLTDNHVIPTFGPQGAGKPGGSTSIVSNTSTANVSYSAADLAPTLTSMQNVIDNAKKELGDPNNQQIKNAQAQLDFVKNGVANGGTITHHDFMRLKENIGLNIEQQLAQKEHLTQAQQKQEDLKKAQLENQAATRPKNTEDAQARATQANQAYRSNPSDQTRSAMNDANEQLQNLRRLDIGKIYAEATARVQAQRNVEDKDIDLIAHELVKPDNLTTLKDIASTRGSERLRIFARAKQIDPSFDPAVTANKAKFLGEFTDPNSRTSMGIDSANTFLQHGGDLLDITKNFRTTNLKAVNAPLNKLRDLAGDGSFSQYKAALDVVRSEYTNAVKAGFAPNLEDSKEGRDIMSDASSPAQVEAATKQMGHTITRRMDSTNEKFKTVLGQNYPNLVTPNALQGAQKLGVDVSKFSSGGTIGKRQKAIGNFDPSKLPDAQ